MQQLDQLRLTHLKKLIEHNTYVYNINSDEILHPNRFPDHYCDVPTALEGAELFLEDIQAINEYDYGDFMRQANMALSELEQHLIKTRVPLPEFIVKLRTYVQFYPNWETESTLNRLCNDAEQLIYFLRELRL